MAQQGKNLDSLMMAYADLSGGNRGSSFKGPPLKEVKIEKAPPPVFKPSSKARDWSNIESVFDDAFVLSPMPIPTAQKVEIQSNPEFSAFSQWQEEPTPQAHFQVPLQPPARQASTDDWGDFQDFQSPSETHKPIVQPVKTIVEDDDFADFVTATCPQSIHSQTHQQINPQMRPEPFSTSSLMSSIPVQPQAASSTNPLSNTVGLRLASFQEESPVHNFKGKTGSKFEAPRLSVSESPSRFEAFFGGTDDDSFPIEGAKIETFSTNSSFEASLSSSNVFDTPIVTLPNVVKPFATLPNVVTPRATFPNVVLPIATLPNMASGLNSGLSSLPPPITASNDKYSALADLLSMSDDFAFSANRQIEPNLETGLSSKPETVSTRTFQTSGTFPESELTGIQTKLELPVKTGLGEEEDFGDFISGATNFGHFAPATKPSFSGFTPFRSNVPVMTWHESRYIFWNLLTTTFFC